MYQDSKEGMGEHILLNLNDCGDISALRDLEKFRLFIGPLLADCNAIELQSVSHQFEGGFTHLSLLTTSHFSAHTWPELSSVAVDLFTCSEKVETEKIVEQLINYFQSSHYVLIPVLR